MGGRILSATYPHKMGVGFQLTPTLRHFMWARIPSATYPHFEPFYEAIFISNVTSLFQGHIVTDTL